MTIVGTSGDDNLNGTSGNDTFNLTQGGNDTAHGAGGDDFFTLGAAFTSADQLDGGTGTDTLYLNGDYSAGVIFNATTLTGFETITFSAGHDYALTTDDATVASGKKLAVNATALGSGNHLTFDGSAELDGTFGITGGAGNDDITIGAGADVVNLTKGGNDTAHGRGGNDYFSLGAALTAADQIDGGTGSDTLSLTGDYSAGVTLGANTITGVERIYVTAGFDYALTTDDGTVAAGEQLIVGAAALGSGNELTFDGSAELDGTFSITGGAGNDDITGGAGADLVNFTAGGNDTANGRGGDDFFTLGAAFAAADQLEGGSGTDTLYLNGDYSAEVSFNATTLTGFEKITFGAGHNYSLTTNNATVATGERLAVNATALGSGNHLTFDGSAELDGTFGITGGAGNDDITGGAGADIVNLARGGNDTAHGGGGIDFFSLGDALTAGDQIDGGTGADTLALTGDYSAGVTFGATTVTGVEKIYVTAGFDYALTTNDGTVAAGERLTVSASALGLGNDLTFDGSAELDGAFTVFGGAGDDDITGGAGNDTLQGGSGDNTFDLSHGGNDIAVGQGGSDQFLLGSAFTAADHINGGTGSGFTFDNDEVVLDGDYTGVHAVVFGAQTMVAVELLTLTDGHSYDLTTHDTTVDSAANPTLTVDASTLGASFSLTFDGTAEADSNFTIEAGAGDDDVTGGQFGDTFDFANHLTAADKINGYDGEDELDLEGDYNNLNAVVFSATTVTNIEFIFVFGAHGYDLTSNDATVAKGDVLTVDGFNLTAGFLKFDGSAETDGSFDLLDSVGNDTLTGGASTDFLTFDMGGVDIGHGGGGDDFIDACGKLTAADQMDGGTGYDFLQLTGEEAPSGAYTGADALVFGATTVTNIEEIDLDPGFFSDTSYNITTNQATVASGETLVVDGSLLDTGESLTFNGSAETNGSFDISGGDGNDTLTGGTQDDSFDLGAGTNHVKGGFGQDTITCGSGVDTLIYTGQTESSSTYHDIIGGFNAAADFFDLNVSVAGYDGQASIGEVNDSTFDANMTSAVAGLLLANHALVVTPGSGTLSGHVFLLVDVDGVAGYTANEDYVFDITGASNLGSLSTSNFI